MKKIYLMLIFCLSFIFSGSVFADRAQVDDQGIKMVKTGGDMTMDDNTKPDDMNTMDDKTKPDDMNTMDDTKKDDDTSDDDTSDDSGSDDGSDSSES